MNKILNYNHYIKEGLINTYPISIYYDTLNDNLLYLNNKGIEYNIISNKINETFKIELSKVDFDSVMMIDSFCGNMGYFLSKIKVIRDNKSNIIKYDYNTFYSDIINNDGLVLYYEAKFDNIIDVDSDKLYHATNIKNIESILKNGLYPKSESKIDYHYERIYLSDNLDKCERIIPKLRVFNSNKIKDYIIIEIDNKDYTYYKDPKSNGFYIYQNIVNTELRILNKIYTTKNIIEFDFYRINKINNPIYLQFYFNNTIVYELYRKDMNKKY